jgi:exosortase A
MVALALGCVITFVGFRQTIVSMAQTWVGSSTYSYCLLILPIVGLLIWRLRGELKGFYPTNSAVGLAAYLCSALLWFGGNIADVQIVQQIALVAMLNSLVWSMLGTAITRILLFPLAFLFFAVPFGDGLVPLLQQWTASFVVAALRVSGIPAIQDGFVLATPNGSWQVAEACSGIRYLIASIVIGVLVAGITYKSWKRRLIFLLFAILLPVVANAIRAYGIVVLAYLTGNAIATGVDHVVYGFVFFSLITAILMVVAVRWFEPRTHSGSQQISRGTSPSANTAFLVAGVTCVAIIVVTATSVSEFLWSRVPATHDVSAIPAPVEWKSVGDLDNEWAPEPRALQQRTIGTFSDGSSRVSACFGLYPEGRRGVELVNTSNLVGDSGIWTVLGRGTRKAVIRGRPTVVEEHEIMHGRDHRLVWLWYSIGNELTSDPYRLRLMDARNRLLGKANGVALYAVSAAYRSDSSEAAVALDSFLK